MCEENNYYEEEIYNGYDDNGKTKEIKGITDTVTDYTYTELSYPCIILKKGTKLEKHKIKVISNMVKANTAGIEKDISIYFDNDGLYKLGSISGLQVSPLLELVDLSMLVAYADKDTPLSGSLIYTLCTI